MIDVNKERVVSEQWVLMDPERNLYLQGVDPKLANTSYSSSLLGSVTFETKSDAEHYAAQFNQILTPIKVTL